MPQHPETKLQNENFISFFSQYREEEFTGTAKPLQHVLRSTAAAEEGTTAAAAAAAAVAVAAAAAAAAPFLTRGEWETGWAATEFSPFRIRS